MSQNNEQEMRKLDVTVQCIAVYNSSIMVPKDLSLEEAIEYAKDHINSINITELEYINDSDEICEDECQFDDEIYDQDYEDDDVEMVPCDYDM